MQIYKDIRDVFEGRDFEPMTESEICRKVTKGERHPRMTDCEIAVRALKENNFLYCPKEEEDKLAAGKKMRRNFERRIGEVLKDD